MVLPAQQIEHVLVQRHAQKHFNMQTGNRNTNTGINGPAVQRHSSHLPWDYKIKRSLGSQYRDLWCSIVNRLQCQTISKAQMVQPQRKCYQKLKGWANRLRSSLSTIQPPASAAASLSGVEFLLSTSCSNGWIQRRVECCPFGRPPRLVTAFL